MANDGGGQERADHLFFRYGFVCYAAADPPRGDKVWETLTRSWPRIDVGEFVIYRHPETRLDYRSENSRHTVLIGHAFVAAPGPSGEPLALAAAATGDELFALLDRLSGRFALLVLEEGAERCSTTRAVRGRSTIGSMDLLPWARIPSCWRMRSAPAGMRT